MKKNWKIAVVIMVLAIPLLTGAFLVAMLQFSDVDAGKQEKKDLTMFSAYTDAEAFQNVPYMVTEGNVEDAQEYARNGYLINVNGSTTEEYKAYLEDVENAGFIKHSDNGADAMEGNVMTSSYTKGNVTLTVAHAIEKDHTYISAGIDVPLSDHLIFQEEYVKDLPTDAKTKIHMNELYQSGNSFVIQLKNGHFIIEDGGKKEDAPYLLEYLESLVPEGEKPVVEAWFITHPHEDHAGAMGEIATTQEYQNRIYVEGFYYYDLSNMMLGYLTLQPGSEQQRNISLYYRAFETTAGETPKLYRPQFGQKYYFCDIEISVALTIEQCSKDVLDNVDCNDSSTWLMHYIDGQKFLCTGDSNFSTQNTAIALLDKSFFEMHIFATPHHAINMYDEFVDVLEVDTLLYTSYRAGSIWQDGTWKEALAVNERMRQEVLEYYHHGDGTVVLTFPYNIGTAETMPKNKWMYNGGENVRDEYWK